MELQTFCKSVGRMIADHPVEAVPGLVAGILPEILRDRGLLSADQKALPPTGYGRHDVFICPDDAFSVIAAVWPAGYVSPIHDHQTWCAFGVFEGVIEETRYRCRSGREDCLDAIPAKTQTWVAGDIAHLPVGGGDIHCMRNPTDRAAVSVHVYGGNSVKLGPNVVNIYRDVNAAVA